jgi:hypothetical protein
MGFLSKDIFLYQIAKGNKLFENPVLGDLETEQYLDFSVIS